MKKGILLIFLATAALFSSCKGPEGPAGKDALAKWAIIDCTVRDLDWKAVKNEDGDILHYSSSVRISELTEFVVDFGTILAYRQLSEPIEKSIQQILPYVRHQSNGVDLWTETIDYEFSENYVTFFLTNSDFYYPQDWNPSTMYFRVVLMW